MGNPIIDLNDGGIIIPSGNIGIGTDGDMHMRMGDNMSMDMRTGEMHVNTVWDDGFGDFGFDDPMDSMMYEIEDDDFYPRRRRHGASSSDGHPIFVLLCTAFVFLGVIALGYKLLFLFP